MFNQILAQSLTQATVCISMLLIVYIAPNSDQQLSERAYGLSIMI